MRMQRDLEQEWITGRNDRRHRRQGSEERRSKVRKDVKDDRDSQRNPAGSMHTMLTRDFWEALP